MSDTLANAHAPWVLFGATGVTGRIVLDHALARGHRPLLAGRDGARLAALAAPHGLGFAVASLDDAGALAAALGGQRLVLNAAGPFALTSAPILAAALAARIDYLDLNGELAALEVLFAADAAARAAGVALVGGAGFGVAASDGLALQLAQRLGGADWLRIAVAVDAAHQSPAVADSTLAVIAAGGREAVAGRLVPARLGARRWRQSLDGKPGDFASAPLAELAAIARAVPGADIVTGVPMPLGQARALSLIAPLLPLLLRIPAVRRAMANAGGHAGSGGARDYHSRVWVTARRGDRELTARLDAGEGFAAAADIAIAAVEATLAVRPAPGAHSPATAFGADFITGVPGITISDQP